MWSLGPRMVTGATPRLNGATIIQGFCYGPLRALDQVG